MLKICEYCSKQVLPKIIWEEHVATPHGRECTRPLRVLYNKSYQWSLSFTGIGDVKFTDIISCLLIQRFHVMSETLCIFSILLFLSSLIRVTYLICHSVSSLNTLVAVYC